MKVSKGSVDYRDANPLRFRIRCGTCSMYRAGGSCTLVAGLIVPAGLCDRYDAKKTNPPARGTGGRLSL